MKRSSLRAIGLAVLFLCGACSTGCQPPGAAQALSQIDLKPGAAPSGTQVAGNILREIDDPHTGLRWLLMRDTTRPGGPGRMVPFAVGQGEARPESRIGLFPAPPWHERLPLSLPIIHTGDRLIIEESTPLVQARLEAVALGPALSGSPFKARLVLGGNVVRAVALAPGRAAFAAVKGIRP